ncbi:phosphoglucosamine mutase [Hydrogenispora ethanolica]|jgi:phosphoglucosamine mutase|uniref:Phosphoglucosamine mutase n=1 Tax=Hydrogenispora ethanolica TaxID=1082276 RepID=A0A4R1QRS0_HYDET|nr:phosphoglucosamine mutase [Hydrogenispora ethanolica]TCL55721.1 phosphoglucosamine mutase [Hydrogenispora ethanolica]
MGRLFGTDGVRGVANQNLTPELAFQLGLAAGYYFKKRSGLAKPQFAIGKDTRISGDMLEAALACGLTAIGADVFELGVIPTPGVAYLCRSLKVTAGAMISASHNPVEDNGIKFFTGEGFKLTDEMEDEIEAIFREQLETIERPTGVGVGQITDRSDAVARYEEFLAGSVETRFDGLRIVVDCGYGASFALAPKVLEKLGAEVIALHDRDNGARINVKCGSTHPEILQREVVAAGAHLGVAHDGDADRIIAVDERGEIVDGDAIIAICALHLKAAGKLKNNKVAVTVYSNLGMIQTLKEHGVAAAVTANGDRYVLEALREQDLVLGGEQSGHIIFLDKNTTGDGVLTALQLIAAVVESGKRLSELAGQVHKFPQVLENVRVGTKEGWQERAAIGAAIARAEAELGDQGRVLVRASGTEPLIRVMAEGPDEGRLRELVGAIAAAIRGELGG